MCKQKSKLFVCLILSYFIMSCTSANRGDVALTMAWKAGPPTKHVVSYELSLKTESEDANGSIKNTSIGNQYKASYSQTISDHPDGLLVRQEDIKVAEPTFSSNDKTPSEMQVIILKLTALLFVSRPDYIMSPNGEFVGFDKFEQFKEFQNAKLKDIVGTKPMLDELMFGSIVEAALDDASLREQVSRDLKLIKDLDQLSLSANQPIEITITPAFTSKDKKDYVADGMLSYQGAHDCNWKNPTGCVELRFNSNDKDVYDVEIVVEPDTLILHSYRANTQVSFEAERDDVKMSNNSSVKYSHTVQRF